MGRNRRASFRISPRRKRCFSPPKQQSSELGEPCQGTASPRNLAHGDSAPSGRSHLTATQLGDTQASTVSPGGSALVQCPLTSPGSGLCHSGQLSTSPTLLDPKHNCITWLFQFLSSLILVCCIKLFPKDLGGMDSNWKYRKGNCFRTTLSGHPPQGTTDQECVS